MIADGETKHLVVWRVLRLQEIDVKRESYFLLQIFQSFFESGVVDIFHVGFIIDGDEIDGTGDG